MTPENIAPCFNCKRFYKNTICPAFPEGIPDEILLGENNHKKPLPNQKNKIVYEKV